MLIGRDPFFFSIVLEPVREWNRNNDIYDFTFCNGSVMPDSNKVRSAICISLQQRFLKKGAIVNEKYIKNI